MFGRERAYRERLADLARLVPCESALNVGCGTGSLAIALRNNWDRAAAFTAWTHQALSAREIEILEHVSRGRTNKDIGSERFISEASVKTHLLHIFAKLDVQDRTQAVTVLDRAILRPDV